MGGLLERGMQLVHFSEPTPQGGDAGDAGRHRRVPYFHVLECQKPAG
jgi:hypothetical protein